MTDAEYPRENSQDNEHLDNIESAIRDVERAVTGVESVLKDRWSAVQAIVAVLVGIALWSVPGGIWHSKWRYALNYEVGADKVIVEDLPHDCAFLAAPLGEKYCHYERVVSVIRWATSQLGNPIVSYDDGKTWSPFTPDSSAAVPKTSTVEEVRISWEKKNE